MRRPKHGHRGGWSRWKRRELKRRAWVQRYVSAQIENGCNFLRSPLLSMKTRQLGHTITFEALEAAYQSAMAGGDKPKGK